MAADGSRRYRLGVEPKPVSEVVARVAPFVRAVAVDAPTLDELTVAISQAMQPALDTIGVLAELDVLAADCPTPTRDGVMQHLFGSGRFEGDRAGYHRWQNSCIDHVLRTRRGMPITLAVVAIEVARRVGVRLAGVGMPGHFLVGDPADRDWFADPFHGRTSLGRQDCRALMMSMGMTRWSERFLQTIPSRLVAARILNNLKLSCERHHDEVRLAIVMQARRALPELGDDPVEAELALAVLN
jgi:regulator of sirC expression with transglutaminase-like and TPR domain